ncbi:MAG: hypothetical protein ACRDND_01645 [Streptosporangiaceae bacterium]
MTDGAADLDDLRWHYGEAYLVEVIGGRWIAQRRDSHETISAAAADVYVTVLEEMNEDAAVRIAAFVSRKNRARAA